VGRSDYREQALHWADCIYNEISNTEEELRNESKKTPKRLGKNLNFFD